MRSPFGRVVLCVLLFGLMTPSFLLSKEKPEPYRESFELIDAQLRQGDWGGAWAASVDRVYVLSQSLVASDLAGAVARLALAEAGLGREDDALWHWNIAQNIDRNVLSGGSLASYGAPGELLARYPLRRENEAPAGWNVFRPEGEVRAGRKLEGHIPQLSRVVASVSVPKGLKIQAIIDSEGRLREPVVVSGALPGMIWEMLEGLRTWRYEPARKGEEAVAVFRTLTLNPPGRKPLSALVNLSPRQVEVEALLRAGNWKEAAKRARKTWIEEINSSKPTRPRIAAALALRALAEAGTGENDSAVCRWQAAQHIHDSLYDADLTPYGSAGGFLDLHRWGAARIDGASGEIREPEIARRTRFTLPAMFRKAKLRGVLVLSGLVDDRGVVHQPVIVSLSASDRPTKPWIESTSTLDRPDYGEDAPWLLSLSALDSFCEWRFKPAIAGGKPLAYQQVVSIPFNFDPVTTELPTDPQIGAAPRDRSRQTIPTTPSLNPVPLPPP